MQTFEERYWSRVQRGAGCWAWKGTASKYGYGVIWRAGRFQRAHRVSWELTNGPIPTDRMVCHTCDNRICVNPDHLYLGTHADNMRDRMERGRTARGERMPHERAKGTRNGNAKVTEADVLEIRRRYQPGLGGGLMREYGISQAALWAIVNRRTWRHVA